jgi:hypothetical protein
MLLFVLTLGFKILDADANPKLCAYRLSYIELSIYLAHISTE